MQESIVQHLTQQTMGKNMLTCFLECHEEIRQKGKSNHTYRDGDKSVNLSFRQKDGHVEVKKITFFRGGSTGDVIYILH